MEGHAEHCLLTCGLACVLGFPISMVVSMLCIVLFGMIHAAFSWPSLKYLALVMGWSFIVMMALSVLVGFVAWLAPYIDGCLSARAPTGFIELPLRDTLEESADWPPGREVQPQGSEVHEDIYRVLP